MQIQENISLTSYNTFGIKATARYFAKFTSLPELDELYNFDSLYTEASALIIGGGSNILLTQDYKGLVAVNGMKGIEVVNEDAQNIYVKAAAGENWHLFVMYCITNNYAGVENLSLIWGSVGAGPMQNIGAYGAEIKDIFYELEAYNIKEKKLQKFTAKDCEFGYRESVFKRKEKGKFVITSVTFKLNKTPVFDTRYGDVRQELDRMGVKDLTLSAVSKAVINIRQSKLPDPKAAGNAGSFFKNPIIPKQQFEKLKQEFAGIVGFAAANNSIKVAAGWLIEQCGWKGYRKGDAGCHEKQALVLVNYGNASGTDIYDLSVEIMHSIEAKFGIILEREVNVL